MPKKTEMNEMNKKMNKFLCYVGKILEWLMEGRHFRKIKIHRHNKPERLGHNFWATLYYKLWDLRIALWKQRQL